MLWLRLVDKTVARLLIFSDAELSEGLGLKTNRTGMQAVPVYSGTAKGCTARGLFFVDVNHFGSTAGASLTDGPAGD